MKSHRLSSFFFQQQLPLLLSILLLLLASSSSSSTSIIVQVRAKSLFGVQRSHLHRPFRPTALPNTAIGNSKHQHQHHFTLRAGSSVPEDEASDESIENDIDTTKEDIESADIPVTTAELAPDPELEVEPEPQPQQEEELSEEGVLIVMDGFCPYHGMYIAEMAESVEGVTVLPILSNYLWNYLQLVDPETEYPRIPQSDEEWESLQSYLTGKTVIGVYCESDSGLADAETIREKLQVLCRDEPDTNPARRNKYLMNQVVGKAGLRTAQQKLCNTVQEARAFARELMKAASVPVATPVDDKDGNSNSNTTSSNSTKSESSASPRLVVVKPVRGVASESVYLCETAKQVKEACRNILASPVFGEQGTHDTVLVQEFLMGQEYAVDVVSRNGQHKVAAVWRYDKRPANGASFVYFQTELVDCDMDENVQAVCNYAIAALQALGVKWGLSHNEMIVTEQGPTLVEVNCRQHNMDFVPLTMTCIGYNALDMTLEAFLGSDEDWDKFPDLPFLCAHGCMVHLVNTKKGILQDVRHLQELHDLPSVMNWQVYEHFATQGEAIEPTIDIRTDAGWVQLANEDPQEMQRDFEQIVAWMPTMFQVTDEGEATEIEMEVKEDDAHTGAIADKDVQEEVKNVKIEASDKEAEVALHDKDEDSINP
jgi:biotin carboxylase